jgi:septum formation protein
MNIILGSQSQGRRAVLESMGYAFTTMPAHLDEKAIRAADPRVLTLLLAHAKANTLLPRIHVSAILITSDQVVACQGEVLEKPESAAQARAYFQKYAQHPADTVTAVVVVNTATHKRLAGVDIATVWFRPIPDEVVAQVLRQDHLFTYAGGFSIEEPLLQDYIARISGERESIIGLPRRLTETLIRATMEQS